MTGPDATLRANGARLVDQLRRDELPAYTEARERSCLECGGRGYVEAGFFAGVFDECPKCDSATGLVQCDPLDVARLLAFCGDEEAHGLADWSQGEAVWDTWPEALRDLAAKLPPKRVVWCESCEPDKDDGSHFRGLCGTDAPAFHYTPAQRWLLVVAAEAVARECREPWFASTSRQLDHVATGLRIEEALDACRAWIARPTPGRERAWVLVVVDSDGHPAWLPSPQNWQGLRPNLAAPLLAAAGVLGPDRVREIASRAIREAVRR